MGALLGVESVVVWPGAGVRQAFVDVPPEGARVEARAVDLEGWVFGETKPVVAVEAVYGGRVVGRSRVGLYARPDLAAGFPDVAGAADAGFRCTVDLLGREPEVDLELRAVLSDGVRREFARIRCSRSWRASRGPERDLVSVVIPCYRQAHFLGEAIESVLEQTYPQVEVLVVDDGSPDNTAAVAARYPTVRYLRKDNEGLAAARNTGIQHTNGDYLVFLDADDLLLPHALQTGLTHMLRHPEAAFVSGHHRLIAADGTVLGVSAIPCPGAHSIPALLRRNYIAMHATVLYRRGVFEHVHGYDASLVASEDYELYLRVVRHFAASCHHVVIADYRRHGGGTNRRTSDVLSTSLAVVAAHRSAASHDPLRRAAYREGRRFARAYYGPAIAAQLEQLVRERRWLQAGLTFTRLARLSPRDAASALAYPPSPRR